VNEDLKKYMEENKKVFLDEMSKLHTRLDKIEAEVSNLNSTLQRHIEFIDKTYEGLKNPINAARRWLGR
jgi:uncharacterized protein YaaN involved in tellurite resistance|tara:strand:+ start:132 stop:338 length:207 start_codon:yes stop_codon:yes gene_type:complete